MVLDMQSTPMVGQINLQLLEFHEENRQECIFLQLMTFQPLYFQEGQFQIFLVYWNSAQWNTIKIIIQSLDYKMKYVTKGQNTASQSSVANKGQIDWNDFNYPICLKIYHYDSDQTPDVHKRKVALLRVNHMLIMIATFLNIIANIAGSAQGVPEGGLRIGISIFLFLFWIPFAFQMLFLPYHIIMKDQGKPIIFYVLSLVVTVWFAIWCIADFADANGFVMVQKNFQAGRGAAGFFGLVTALLMLAIALLTPINAFLFSRR